jgi:molybdopterin-containing oxidoreductase family iron-sulfur binding subunit
MQALFNRDRLERPILRADAGAQGTAVEWDPAIEVLRDRIGKLVSSGDGDRIAVVDGRTRSLGTLLLESWVSSIPGARYIPFRIEGAIDRLVREILGGAPGGRVRLDLARTGTILLVGSELLELDGSPVSQARAHGDRRGDPRLDHAPTIYLGPRQSPTAVHGDYWIPCHPSQERDILLAFAEALSREQRGASTLSEYARWIPEARDPVSFAGQYSLETVARRQGLNREELEAAAQALREFGPAVTVPGPGILRRPHGFQDARAALALNLWTGGFSQEGGLSWGPDPLDDVASRLALRPPREDDPSSLFKILKPLFEIRRSPVDLLLCIEANLVHELPGRDQIARALSHVPFVASFSTDENETSRLAHITIPSLLDLESWDLPAAAWGVPEASFQVQRPALVPVVEGRSVEDVILDLASAGVAGTGFSPSARDAKGLVEAAVGLIVKRGRGELVDSKGRRPLASVDGSSAVRSLLFGESAWVTAPEPGRKTARSTATAASPPPPPDLAPEQLWLVPFDGAAIQGGRILSRPMMMEMSGMLHGLAWESWVEIHPKDARSRNIASGNRVKIRGPRAEITTRAVVTRTVAPGVVAAPVGFGREGLSSVAGARGANPLELPFAVLDEKSGAPAWGPIPVFMVKA